MRDVPKGGAADVEKDEFGWECSRGNDVLGLELAVNGGEPKMPA